MSPFLFLHIYNTINKNITVIQLSPRGQKTLYRIFSSYPSYTFIYEETMCLKLLSWVIVSDYLDYPHLVLGIYCFVLIYYFTKLLPFLLKNNHFSSFSTFLYAFLFARIPFYSILLTL